MLTAYAFDLLFVAAIIGGGMWGYASGGAKTGVKWLFIFLPSITLAYFGDQVTALGNEMAGLLGDRSSLPLGLVGSIGGLLGMSAIVGLVFLTSRVAISMMNLHEPGTTDRRVGIVLGAGGSLFVVTALFICIIKAAPDRATRLADNAVSWPLAKPILTATYPTIGGFVDRRMSTLINGLSGNGLLARLAAGGDQVFSAETLEKVVMQVRQVDFKDVMSLQRQAAALDPEEARRLVNAYQSGELSEERLRDKLTAAGLDR